MEQDCNEKHSGHDTICKLPPQVYPVVCDTCKGILGFTFMDFFYLDTVYCYLCAHNITQLGEVLGAKNIPKTDDIYRASNNACAIPYEAQKNAIALRSRIKQLCEKLMPW